MNPTCAEHEELLRISQERVKRLEDVARDARGTILDLLPAAGARLCELYGKAAANTHAERANQTLASIDAALRPEGT